MAAALKNTGTAKITRGRPTKVGTITAANDAVQFTISEPTRDHQGVMIVQCSGGNAPTGALEGSLDGASKWFDIPGTAISAVADFGDSAATLAISYNVSGMGGITFRFGRTDANGGGADVWVNVG